MKRFFIAAAWVAVLALGGCESDMLMKAPVVALPSAYKDAGPAGAPPAFGEAWWRSFADRRLNELEAEVDASSPDLAAALAANDAAQAHAQQSHAALVPEIDANGSLSANKQSKDRPLRSKGQPDYYGNNQLYAQTSYEVDIWGRVRDLVKAADANAEASAAAFAEAKLELHAELARYYVELRGIDNEKKLLSDTIGVYKNALDLTQSRLKGQIATPIDVDRAQTQLSAVEAQETELALRRAQLEDSIAPLVGKAAASFHVPQDVASIPTPRRPRTVPGDVLRRRPDVTRKESLVNAAGDYVGAAHAALYPRFTIGLLGGTQDTGLNLLSLANSVWTVGPSVSYPLFDAGLRQAQLEEAKARFRQASSDYRATVLNAVKEVEDSLAALKWLDIESRQQALAASAAQKAADISMTLYRDGAASFLDVVTAQDASLIAQRASIALHTRQLEAEIGLMLALGGGWVAPAKPSAVEAGLL